MRAKVQNNMTPMMRQYFSFKRKHEDALLLFRMGDFYELFYEDAKIVARVLGLALTSREKGENPIPMAGFPCHAAENYIKRLVENGHRVAVCEQVEDPSEAKGLVRRDVVRIITAGTLTEENILDRRSNNFLAAACPGEDGYGLAWVDLSTGGFELEEIAGESPADSLRRIAPAECLMPEGAGEEDPSMDHAISELDGRCMLTRRPPWEFSTQQSLRVLNEHFGTASLDGFGCAGMDMATGAAGAVLAYLQATQKGAVSHIKSIKPFNSSSYLVLDRTTQRSLELVEPIRAEQKGGTLISVLDHTRTPPGARLLRRWMLTPLKDPAAIGERLGAVEEFVKDARLREKVHAHLSNVYDIERLATKVATARANARDLTALRDSIAQIPLLKDVLSGAGSTLLCRLREELDPVREAAGLVTEAISPDPPVAITEGGIIKNGYSAELDELRHTAARGKEWLAGFEAAESEKTGIPSLKIGYNKVFGYYLEVTNSHKDKVPDDYMRKQTLKNAERYITPELKEWESRVLSAAERAMELEYVLFGEIRREVSQYTERLQCTAGKVAKLDSLLSLGIVAAQNGYVRPVVDDNTAIEIKEGRHPVLEQIMDEQFVPNDTTAGGNGKRLLIVTGPNMAGKSVYIRQTALLVLMAQMGSFVPAKSARIGAVDRIFTRVGASDVQIRGQSTFMVEMVEVANILNNATSRSLIILDEVGRGTSTYDGVSIAWATAEHIHNEIGANTLFATHYHELAQLSNTLDGVQNLNVAVRDWEGEVVFLHRIIPGHADQSYGIHVARLAGVPDGVVRRGREILQHLEANAIGPDDRPRFAPPVKKPGSGSGHVQTPLFRPLDEKIKGRLRSLRVEEMTPLEAMKELDEIIKLCESG